MRRRGPQGSTVRLHRRRRSACRQCGAAPARSSSTAPDALYADPSPVVLDGACDLNLALLDPRSLAGGGAQIVELRATDAATADDVHVAEHGAVDREDALDADAVGDLANGEGLADAAAALGDAHALERLQPLLLTFLYTHVHAQRVARAEGRNVGAEEFLLGLNEYMHRALGAIEQGPGKVSWEDSQAKGSSPLTQ